MILEKYHTITTVVLVFLLFGALFLTFQGSLGPTNLHGLASLDGPFGDPIDAFLAEEEIQFSTVEDLTTLDISITDEIIYMTAYLSLNGLDWEEINLEGSNTQFNKWFANSASKTITLNASQFIFTNNFSSDNYIIIFSCNKNDSVWDCHNNSWQLRQFNASLNIGSGQNSNVVLNYTFEDASGVTLTDTSGNAYDGLILGDTSWTTGIFGDALSFDGSNDYVDLPDLGSYSNVTVSVWIRPEGFSTYNGIFSSDNWTANTLHFKLQNNGVVSINSPNGSSVVSSVPVSLNQWTHLAYTWNKNANQYELFVDGVSQGYSSLGSNNLDLSNQFIGREYGDRYFTGRIDELQVYDIILSDSEIATLAGVSIQPDCFVDDDCTGLMVCDTGSCVYECGNNILESGETCDGTNLGSESCESQGFVSGSLACSSDCLSYDTSNCVSGSGPMTYYVDAVNGDDSNVGSQANPFASFDKVMTVLQDGDTALFYNGDYGDISVGNQDCPDGSPWCPKDEFNDWTTIKAAPGQTPHFDNVIVGDDISDVYVTVDCEFRSNGCNNNYYIDDGEGLAQIYMIFDGLTISEGISIAGANHFILKNSFVEIPGPWDGSEAAIDRSAISTKFASDLVLENNEVTDSGDGITLSMASYRIIIKDNTIHDISQDGIQLISSSDVLIEGNEIYNLDDGIDDESGLVWNRHCDGIQMYPYADSPILWLRNITIRGNRIYNTESMGLMVNTKPNAATTQQEYIDIVIENNIIGDGRGARMHFQKPVDGLIIRHNSFVSYPNSGFQSKYRYVTTGPSVIYFPFVSDPVNGVEIYNNIFNSWPSMYNFDYDRFDHNIIYGEGPAYYGLGLGSYYLDENPFETPSLIDGVLKSDSVGIDGGTKLDETFYSFETTSFPKDINGILRDNRPDIGAVEASGRSPPAENFPLSAPANPTVFVDDFETAFVYRNNPFLNTVNATSINWLDVPGFNPFTIDYNSLRLTRNRFGATSCTAAPNFVRSQESFTDFLFSVNALTTHKHGGELIVLLFQDSSNYYAIDFSSGSFVRRVNGVNTILDSSSGLKVSNVYSGTPTHSFDVEVNHEVGGIHFLITIDDSLILDYLDTDSTAMSLFGSGNIGFARINSESCGRGVYDDVRVEVI